MTLRIALLVLTLAAVGCDGRAVRQTSSVYQQDDSVDSSDGRVVHAGAGVGFRHTITPQP